MYRNIYAYVECLLIIWVYATIISKSYIAAGIQLGIKAGIIGDGEEIQRLDINPEFVKVQSRKGFRNYVVANRKIPAS